MCFKPYQYTRTTPGFIRHLIMYTTYKPFYNTPYNKVLLVEYHFAQCVLLIRSHPPTPSICLDNNCHVNEDYNQHVKLKNLFNYKACITSHHITPLVIYSLRGRLAHTYRHHEQSNIKKPGACLV